MTRRYDSFVVRTWQVSDQWRIEVEHIQSGERTRAETLTGALTWIDIHCRSSAEPDSEFGPTDAGPKEVLHSEHRAADEGSAR